MKRNEEELKDGETQTKKQRTTVIDMFSLDDDEDGVDVDGSAVVGAGAVAAGPSAAAGVLEGHEAFDDEEGYYKFSIGDVLGGRYRVARTLGRGVFGSVLECTDARAAPGSDARVAIKVARANDTMRKAGQREVAVLRQLADAAKDSSSSSSSGKTGTSGTTTTTTSTSGGRTHCVELRDAFDFRGHMCIVLEHMDVNLRQLLAQYGRNVGISLGAVRLYAQQLFAALRHIHRCGLVHADIKLDNILVSATRTSIKVCDFGTAFEPAAAGAAPTPYLASRFYRAPEAVLGIPCDGGVDVWAAACCLAELYTGRVLFPGASNNGMLRLFCELCGAFPKRVLRRAPLRADHFDDSFRFLWRDVDSSTKPPRVTIRTLVFPTPNSTSNDAVSSSSSSSSTGGSSGGGSSTGGNNSNYFCCRTMMSVLCPTPGDMPASATDRVLLQQLKDLLIKCLCLDNTRRLTAAAALKHPFCTM